MTVEYVLLLLLFILTLAGSIIKGPFNAFADGGPKLAARIERHLITGDGFRPNHQLQQWESQ